MTAEAKLIAAATELRKGDPGLSQAQAIAKAAEQDPDLHSQVLREAGIPWQGDPTPPPPPEPVAKAVRATAEEEAAQEVVKLAERLSEAAGISYADAYGRVVDGTREGSIHAASATRDLRAKARYHEISKTAPAFFEVCKAAEDAKAAQVAKRLAELVR